METYEYQIVKEIVKEYETVAAVAKINELAKKGYRVTQMVSQASSSYIIYLLERKVLPAHPYR